MPAPKRFDLQFPCGAGFLACRFHSQTDRRLESLRHSKSPWVTSIGAGAVGFHRVIRFTCAR